MKNQKEADQNLLKMRWDHLGLEFATKTTDDYEKGKLFNYETS